MGFANQTLWPLCHLVFQPPVFSKKFWDDYTFANNEFAEACLEIAGDDISYAWIQDYHLALCPKLIKEKNSRIRLAQFWHIPFPLPKIMETCPWGREILEGLLFNDLLGFHTDEHRHNFMSCVSSILGADVDGNKIKYGGNITNVGVYPISVDYAQIAESSSTDKVSENMEKIRREHSGIIVLGVDRIDYTKGIIERLRAIDRFLEKYPEYLKIFSYVELGAPSRGLISSYRELDERIDKLIDDINWKYLVTPWKPINYIKRSLHREKVLAYYRVADVCIVSSLDDGMNLVAKEFVAAQDGVKDNGTLVLSKFAGAKNELSDAIIINPYDIEEFAEKIKYAIEMSLDEKNCRMRAMQSMVKTFNIYKWVYDFISDSEKFLKDSDINDK